MNFRCLYYTFSILIWLDILIIEHHPPLNVAQYGIRFSKRGDFAGARARINPSRFTRKRDYRRLMGVEYEREKIRVEQCESALRETAPPRVVTDNHESGILIQPASNAFLCISLKIMI